MMRAKLRRWNSCVVYPVLWCNRALLSPVCMYVCELAPRLIPLSIVSVADLSGEGAEEGAGAGAGEDFHRESGHAMDDDSMSQMRIHSFNTASHVAKQRQQQQAAAGARKVRCGLCIGMYWLSGVCFADTSHEVHCRTAEPNDTTPIHMRAIIRRRHTCDSWLALPERASYSLW